MRQPLAFLISLVVVVPQVRESHAADLEPASDRVRPRGTYVMVEPDPTAPRFGPGPVRRIIYMNRHGGTYTPGGNNSSQNVSSIPYRTSTVSPFPLSDDRWQQFMDCSRAMFAPFDVEITDVDPGDVPHIESVVGGYPQEVGMGSGVGGVAPMNTDCSVVERAVVYTFAGVYGSNVQAMCEVAAQETAHALGLDHEYLCQDPMTYLSGCGAKTFQDVDAQCGEYGARQCMCGGSRQNSVRLLRDTILGPADNEPPVLNIASPRDGDTVDPGFAVTGTASDDRQVTKVELFIDGALAMETGDRSYTFPTDPALPPGPHTLEVRAHDEAGNVTPASVSVTLRAVCSTDAECGLGQVCSAGECVAEPGGDPPGGDDDPPGGGDDGSPGGGLVGGCAVGGPGGAPGGMVVLFVLGLGFAARRRRR